MSLHVIKSATVRGEVSRSLRNRLRVVSCVWLLSLCGCFGSSTESPPAVQSADVSKVSYTLYMTRGSLTSQEFEQYKTLPQGVFLECGTIHRGRPQTAFQGLETGAAERQDPAKIAAHEVLALLASGEEPKIDEPGTGTGFADPGKFILTISDGGAKREIKTSLDWVEQKRTSFASKLHSFGELVRAIPSNPPCGNSEFYGLAR